MKTTLCYVVEKCPGDFFICVYAGTDVSAAMDISSDNKSRRICSRPEHVLSPFVMLDMWDCGHYVILPAFADTYNAWAVK